MVRLPRDWSYACLCHHRRHCQHRPWLQDPLARETEAKNRAKLSADNATELNVTCKMQCQLYPLNQNVPQMGCCDDVWVSGV
jgi:hypothetical protein